MVLITRGAVLGEVYCVSPFISLFLNDMNFHVIYRECFLLLEDKACLCLHSLLYLRDQSCVDSSEIARDSEAG